MQTTYAQSFGSRFQQTDMSDASTILRIISIRAVFWIVGAGCGWLAGLVAGAVWSPQSQGGPSGPIAIWCAAIACVCGFLFGERDLSGRTGQGAWGIAGGILCGAIIGWGWAHFEHHQLVAQLAAAGTLPQLGKMYPRVADHEAIGLQHGIPFGALIGLGVGLLWNRSKLAIVGGGIGAICIIAIFVIRMRSEFHKQTESELKMRRRVETETDVVRLWRVRSSELSGQPDDKGLVAGVPQRRLPSIAG